MKYERCGGRMLERLFPQEEKFFAEFGRITDQLTRAAALLQHGFEEPSRWPTLLSAIEDIQREADAASHTIDLSMDRMFVTPLDPEDILRLSARLRRVVDIIAGTARRAVCFRVKERQEAVVRLCWLLVRAGGDIHEALIHFREANIVQDRSRSLRQYLDQGEAAHAEGVSALFLGNPNPIDVIRWKAIYDLFEEALGACEEVTNVLESIALKHA